MRKSKRKLMTHLAWWPWNFDPNSATFFDWRNFPKTHFHKARVETPQGVVRCSPMCIHDRTCYPRKEKRDVSPLFSCQKPALDVPLLCTPWQSSLTEPKEEVQDSERQDMKWFKGRSSSKLSLSSSFRHSSEAAVDGSKDEVQRDCERWQWLVPIGTNSLKDNLWLKIPLIPGCPTFWRGGSTGRSSEQAFYSEIDDISSNEIFSDRPFPGTSKKFRWRWAPVWHCQKRRDHSIDVQWLSTMFSICGFKDFPLDIRAETTSHFSVFTLFHCQDLEQPEGLPERTSCHLRW